MTSVKFVFSHSRVSREFKGRKVIISKGKGMMVSPGKKVKTAF